MTDPQSLTSVEFGVRHHLLMARRAAVAYARAERHDMGRWTVDGLCECHKCGAALTEHDALAFVDGGSAMHLGSLSMPCIGAGDRAC